jgi:hypothetical protein
VRTDISTDALAALLQPTVPLAMLIDMDLSEPFRLNTTAWNLEWGGETYVGAGAVGRIEEMESAPGEIKGLRFTINGVPSELLALALAEPVQGKAVTVSTAIFSNSSYLVLDVVPEWLGRLDTMTINEEGDKATIIVTAEHVGIDLLRSNALRYSHADQMRLYPGDRSFEYVSDQSDKPIVWPSREFYKQ